MAGAKLGGFNVVKHETENAFLLVLESADSKAGLLGLAGGGYDDWRDETITAAAARDGGEESGLTITPYGTICQAYYPNQSGQRLHTIYASRYVGTLQASEEHRLVGFFPFETIKEFDEEKLLRGPIVLESIRQYRKGEIHPLIPFMQLTELRNPRPDYPDNVSQLAAQAVQSEVYVPPVNRLPVEVIAVELATAGNKPQASL